MHLPDQAGDDAVREQFHAARDVAAESAEAGLARIELAFAVAQGAGELAGWRGAAGCAVPVLGAAGALDLPVGGLLP